MDQSEVKNLQNVETPGNLDGPSRLIWKAAKLIEERGLAKGTLQSMEGHLCMLGALFIADGVRFPAITAVRSDDCHRAQRRMEHAIFVKDGAGIAAWNDAPHRTKEQVIERLKDIAVETNLTYSMGTRDVF